MLKRLLRIIDMSSYAKLEFLRQVDDTMTLEYVSGGEGK